jgi:hypothetical protein
MLLELDMKPYMDLVLDREGIPPMLYCPLYLHTIAKCSKAVQSQVVQGRKLRSQVPLIVLVLGLLLVVLDLLLVALLLLLVLPFLLLSPLFDPDHDRKNNALDLKDLHLPLLMMHLPLMGQQRGKLP